MTTYLLKRLAYAATLLLFVAACTATTEVAESTSTPTREPVAQVEPTVAVVDPTSTPQATLPPVSTVTEVASTPVPAATATAIPTVAPTPAPTPTRVAVAAEDHNGLAGSRGLTLQWISWEPEDWGTIEFVPLVDGSYAVEGTQTGPGGDFVTVSGTIVRVSDRELLFTGDVVAQVSYNNEGQPCVRSGDVSFLATGDRRFWRMQDLLNCDGIVTDYVDIYFG